MREKDFARWQITNTQTIHCKNSLQFELSKNIGDIVNRRSFLGKIGKICGLIPFVGTLAATGESGSSEGQPEKPSTGVDPNSDWAKQKVLTLAELKKIKEKFDAAEATEFICKSRCNCREQRVTEVCDRIMVLCPNHPPYWVNKDGSKESVFYYPRAIDIQEQGWTHCCSGLNDDGTGYVGVYGYALSNGEIKNMYKGIA